MAVSNSVKRGGGWAALALVCVSGFEGLRTAAYFDPVGIPTVCFGETHGVRMGDRYTSDQCRAMLAEQLRKYNAGINKCLRVELPEARRAALVSFSYNVGVDAFCKSTLLKKLNAGDTAAACDELFRWNTATKAGVRIELPGLTRRRAEEWQLCRDGL